MVDVVNTLVAVFKYGNTTVASGVMQNVEFETTREVHRHYGMGNDGVPSLTPGHLAYVGSAEKLFLDEDDATAILAAMEAGSPLATVKFYPQGLAAGTVHTLTNVLFSAIRHRAAENEVVIEGLEFEGEGYAVTAVT